MSRPSIAVEGAGLALDGEVTIATVSALFGQLEGAFAKLGKDVEVNLDCAAMAPADSGAIALLVEIHQLARARGKSLRITGLKDNLISLIRIYGVEWVLAAENREN